jgi:hypothetical protein
MENKIIKPNEKISHEVVEQFEVIIGKKLPDDYKALLLDSNGGEPQNDYFEIAKNNSRVRYFYGITNKGNIYNLIYERKLRLDRVPNDVLPIGTDYFGNCICLSLRSETYGQIFFWDHELESSDGEPATFKNLFLVAKSFGAFFKSLKKFDASKI